MYALIRERVLEGGSDKYSGSVLVSLRMTWIWRFSMSSHHMMPSELVKCSKTLKLWKKVQISSRMVSNYGKFFNMSGWRKTVSGNYSHFFQFFLDVVGLRGNLNKIILG